MRISAVIITFNEEKNIERCIKSLLLFADEIIVVDSFSTDKTEEICRSFPQVKFYQNKWLGYSEQKNYANSLASFDNVFSIDADEEVSEKLKDSICYLKKQYESLEILNTVFSVNRLTNYCGKWIHHSGWYPDKKIRFFPKNIKWKGDIHEILELPPDIKVIKLKGDLNHYTVYNTVDHLKQLDKFTTIASKELFNKGKKVNYFDISIRPQWRFFRDYLLKLGFLDGYAGYQICKISSFATFLKYAKLKELRKNLRNEK
ncbi:MAG: glycosyltransferase family 2 protein [Bacteroidales bacterium]|jgi:glycosyltransferase involved in cell wall biosynthesis